MRAAHLIASLALTLITPGLAAPREWPATSTGVDLIQMITDTLSSGSQATADVNKDPEDEKAYVLVEYAVPPAVNKEFIAAFEKTAEPTKQEEGSIVYTLSRAVDENLAFWLYSEWDGMKAVGEHFESEYLKEYLETIRKLNVVYKLHVLTPVVY